jgi:hypothetical protein
MDTPPRDVTVKEFINQVFLNEYKRIVDGGFHYISFALMALGIEFLGACLDPYGFGETRLSRVRFTNAIQTLFPDQYHQYGQALYEDLRSGFAHQFRPGLRFVLTHREDTVREGTKHLGPFGNSTVLVAEVFYADFEKACREVITRIDNHKLTHAKLSARFLKIT